MRFKLNNRGFTLVSAVVGMGILGILAVASMQIAENISDSISRARATADELMLVREVDRLVYNTEHCRVSMQLNNGNPIPAFVQNDFSESESLLNVELRRLQVDGSVRKKLSATDDNFKKYGSLTIDQIGVYFPEAFTPGVNQGVDAELVFKLKRRKLSDRTLSFPIKLNITTDGANNATIDGCKTPMDDAILSAQMESCLQSGMFWDENATPACSDSMGDPTNTIDQGGGGGETVTFPCPDGYIVTGFRGRSGKYLDQVSFRCHRFSFATMKPYGGAYYTKSGGGSGGGPFIFNCPAEKIVVGFRGGAGKYIDRLGLICGDLDHTNITFTPQKGGGGGSPFTRKCPLNTAIRGFYGRVGKLVDGLGAFCK